MLNAVAIICHKNPALHISKRSFLSKHEMQLFFEYDLIQPPFLFMPSPHCYEISTVELLALPLRFRLCQVARENRGLPVAHALFMPRSQGAIGQN
jgi:hypothetical protein